MVVLYKSLVLPGVVFFGEENFMILHTIWGSGHSPLRELAMLSVAKAPELPMECGIESPTKDLLDVIEFVEEQHQDPWHFGDKGSRN